MYKDQTNERYMSLLFIEIIKIEIYSEFVWYNYIKQYGNQFDISISWLCFTSLWIKIKLIKKQMSSHWAASCSTSSSFLWYM